MQKWINETDLLSYPEISDIEIKTALKFSVEQMVRNIYSFKGNFPGAASFNGFYKPGVNKGWTTGFFTGETWLSYENASFVAGERIGADGKLRENPEGASERTLQDVKDFFSHAAERQVLSFLSRIERKADVDHHDMGFLYSSSCVAAWKLRDDENGRKAALLAADQLISRFQPVGEFIQAWGRMGAPENYRFIIDCLLNLPLLYWATGETGDPKYRDIAEKHIHTAMANVIREDDSTWHTVFMNPKTGKFDHGATCQGYKDGSAWARGQAWGVYGTAVAYKYTKRPEYFSYFKRVTGYFLHHLPKDLVPYWDLTFGDGDDEPRDSSSAVIAACGMLEMAKYLSQEEAAYYTSIARKLLKALYDACRVTDPEESNGLLLHGTYSKKSPYNTCTPEGVDECVIWGDYYWMEALNRLYNPSWQIYW